MSAPDTDTKKQARRHRPALWGIAAVLVFAFIIAVIIVGGFFDESTTGDAEDVNPRLEESERQDSF